MKSEKNIAIVTAIVILLLATALGGFSPISYAQVEQEIDQAAEQEVTNATDTEQETVEAAEQEATDVEGSTEQEIDQAAEQEATDVEGSTEQQVVEAAEQEVTNATNADQAGGEEQIV